MNTTSLFPDLEIAYIGLFRCQEHEYGYDWSLPGLLKGVHVDYAI